MNKLTGDPDSSTAHVGQFVTLRAVGRADYPIFLQWRTDIKELHVWSSARLVPTVEGFEAEMDRLLSQSTTLLALHNQSGEPIGFVQAYNINPTDGWCMLRVYFAPEYRGRETGIEACLIFVDYLFANIALRKIYIDLPEFNRGLLGSMFEGGLSEEGRFREHTWYEGRYWDSIRLALFLERWPELRERIRVTLQVGAEAAELVTEKQEEEVGRTDVGS